MRILTLVLVTVFVSACASTQTVYAPASVTASGTGYSDVRIESDRWRITFEGAGDVSEAEAERLALRRAGDLALQHGFEWFEVVDRRTERLGEDRNPVRVGGSIGRTFGSRGYSGSSVGLGISLSPGEERRTIVSLEIIAGQGEPRPEHSYDAAAVAQPYGSIE